MLTSREAIVIRPADAESRVGLSNLIQFEQHLHRHLDWRSPLDWIGQEPFMIAEVMGKLVGALACPPDPPHIAWIRLFVAADALPAARLWDELWSAARQELDGRLDSLEVAVMPLGRWFQQILGASGFIQTSRVVMLYWTGSNSSIVDRYDSMDIRAMKADDLGEVEIIDMTAFQPIWQISRTGLVYAFQQSACATVAVWEGNLVGYQISTASASSGHLARLAVLPKYQGKGIGSLLVKDMLKQLWQRGVQNVTVNTQVDNVASLALYRNAGFRQTGEEYPLYLWKSI